MASRQTRIAHGLIIFGSSLVLLALFTSSAKAVQTIDINPGAIGGPADEFGWETDDDQFTFDIVFTDSKALEWGPGTQIFRLLAPFDAGQDFFGAFLDGAGEPILGTAFVGKIGTDLSPGDVAVAVLDEQVVFRGMRFIAASQNPPGPGFSKGLFEIRWVSDAPVVVPEPSTALLLGMGLLGLGARRSRAADPPPL